LNLSFGREKASGRVWNFLAVLIEIVHKSNQSALQAAAEKLYKSMTTPNFIEMCDSRRSESSECASENVGLQRVAPTLEC
jgi:hypothetical protein